MNVMKFTAIFLLLVVIMLSGCTFLRPDDDFGEDVVNPELTTRQGVKDIIIIKDIETMPQPNVLPDMSLLVMFTIENRDSDLAVENVVAELYNPFIFYNVTSDDCSYAYCPTQCRSDRVCTILPLGEKPVQFKLKSPTAEEIAAIRTDAELDFSVIYDFTSSSNYPVLVVAEDEILRAKRANEKIEAKLTASSSGGPVQISTELTGRKFLLEGARASIKFVIRNMGSNGDLVDSVVGIGNITIKLPKAILGLENANTESILDDAKNIVDVYQFSPKSSDTNNIIYTNDADIDLYADESSPIIFTIDPVEGSRRTMATYMIMASVSYSYEIRDKAEITIVLD